ncbi:MAG: glycine cleavage system aminomethyltransferase GcvT [Candidatus Latescibacterota bacterium]|nr:MAG: glycine cleavage system aminomethyltransferase GcvT [Candidatus Latescibacterota bacterium]
MTNIKRTPLADVHETLGARMVEFAGFWMPVSYGGIIEEHLAVRERVGLFDVSHMGEFIVSGARAREFVNQIITNDCSKLEPGAIQYTAMCCENGTVVDDLLVSAIDGDRLMLVVNASNIDKDWEHIAGFDRPGGVEIENASDGFALLAVQGPKCREVLHSSPLFDGLKQQIDKIPYYRGFTFEHDGSEIFVSRTGYTGELGFEIFLPSVKAVTYWNEILRTGSDFGIKPIGLGARDTLRFEASYCLYGHELDENTSPLEAGLGWVVKLKKEQFCGIDALRAEKKNGPARTLVGFELEGRNIARQGYAVLTDGVAVGHVTSGAFAPALAKSLCMALIKRDNKNQERMFEIEIRNKKVPAKLTPLPFYKSRSK